MPPRPPKIVYIGAGSRTFAPAILRDFYRSEQLSGGEIVLVDTDESALDRMRPLAERLEASAGARYRVSYETDRRKALPGADFIVLSVAVERFELWRQDYIEPLRFGFNHCYGENGGPGAVFHTLRNLPVVMPMAQDIEELCPEAWLITFTNPENRICLALRRHSRVKTIGLCHGIRGTLGVLAGYLGVPRDRLDAHAGGVNHLTWLLKLWDTATGEDLIPRLRARIQQDGPPRGYELCCKLLDVFGCFPTTGDSHVGEFFAFGQEYHTSGFDADGFAASARQAEEFCRQIAAGELPAEEWLSHSSGEIAIPVMEQLHGRTNGRLISVIVPNDGAIPNLPAESVVETAGLFADGAVRGECIGPLPPAAAAATRRELDIQELVVEAWATGSRRAALQALLLDPNVNSITRAEALLDRMLDLQREHLPPLA